MVLENINKLCKEKGISIRKLERTLGIGNGTVGGWDKYSPTLATVKAVADYFGVTIDSLVNEQHE